MKKNIFDDYKIHIILGGIILFIIGCVVIDIVFIKNKAKGNEISETEVLDLTIQNNNENADMPEKNSDQNFSTNEVTEYSTLLAYNSDTRDGYMNNCIFLGDSRSVAMVTGGFVSDDNVLAQVGIAHINFMTNTFTMSSGQKYTLDSYLDVHKAPVIYISLGVNGINWIDENTYKTEYKNLVLHIMKKCPDSAIVIQAIWPVEDDGLYSESVKNSMIDKYNIFLYELASELGVYYIDLDVLLKDEDGTMKDIYNGGDGLHYAGCAYTDILDYIIHHPVPGVSDEGEFVVKYVAPTEAYKRANSGNQAEEGATGKPAVNQDAAVSENELTEEELLQKQLEEEQKKKEEEQKKIEEEERLRQEEEDRLREEEEEKKRQEEEEKKKKEEEKKKEQEKDDDSSSDDNSDNSSEDNQSGNEGDNQNEEGSENSDNNSDSNPDGNKDNNSETDNPDNSDVNNTESSNE